MMAVMVLQWRRRLDLAESRELKGVERSGVRWVEVYLEFRDLPPSLL
jgi:hypothetical protein